jgi:phenylacetate-CoA ligase
MKYWQPKYETMDPEELKRLQLKRLQHSVKLVYDNVPFYRQKLKRRE